MAGPSWGYLHHDYQHSGRTMSTSIKNPSLLWHKNLEVDLDGEPVIEENQVMYIASYKGVYALNLKTQELLWSNKSVGWAAGLALVPEKKNLYVPSMDYNLYCLNLNGKEMWVFPTYNMIQRPPTVGPDGNIYFCSDDRIYCIA
jgi:outer membrane protein assembly factor BamB